MNFLRVKKLKTFLLLLVVDVFFFGFTNPSKTASIVVVLGFILLILSFYMGLDLLTRLLITQFALSEQNRRKVVLLVSVLCAILLAMQSIGQLTLKDTIAIIPLVAILYFYPSYYCKKRT